MHEAWAIYAYMRFSVVERQIIELPLWEPSLFTYSASHEMRVSLPTYISQAHMQQWSSQKCLERYICMFRWEVEPHPFRHHLYYYMRKQVTDMDAMFHFSLYIMGQVRWPLYGSIKKEYMLLRAFSALQRSTDMYTPLLFSSLSLY